MKKAIFIALMCLFLMGTASALTCQEIVDDGTPCSGTCNNEWCNGTGSFIHSGYNVVTYNHSVLPGTGEEEIAYVIFEEISYYGTGLTMMSFFIDDTYITFNANDTGSDTTTGCLWQETGIPTNSFSSNMAYTRYPDLGVTQIRFNGIGNFSAGFGALTGGREFVANAGHCRMLSLGITTITASIDPPDCLTQMTEDHEITLGYAAAGNCRRVHPSLLYPALIGRGNAYHTYDLTWKNDYVYNISTNSTSYLDVTKNISGVVYPSQLRVQNDLLVWSNETGNPTDNRTFATNTLWYRIDIGYYGNWKNSTYLGLYAPDYEYTTIVTGGSGLEAPDNTSLAVCEAYINVIPDIINQDANGGVTIPWEYQTDTTGIVPPISVSPRDWKVSLYSMVGNEIGAFLFESEAFVNDPDLYPVDCLDGLSDPHYFFERLAIGEYKIVLSKGNLGWGIWDEVASDRFAVLPFNITQSRIEWTEGKYFTTKDAQLNWYVVNNSTIKAFHANDTEWFTHDETNFSVGWYVVLTIPIDAPEGEIRGWLRDNSTGEVWEVFADVADIRKLQYSVNFENCPYAWGEDVVISYSCRDDVTFSIYDGDDEKYSTTTSFSSPLTSSDNVNFTLPTRDVAITNKVSAGTWTVRMYTKSDTENLTAGTEVANDTCIINDYNVSDRPIYIDRPSAFKGAEGFVSWTLGVKEQTAAYFLGMAFFLFGLIAVLRLGADREAVFATIVVLIAFLSWINWMPAWAGLLAILGGVGLFAKKVRDTYAGDE